jgi:hypothetical protein
MAGGARDGGGGAASVVGTVLGAGSAGPPDTTGAGVASAAHSRQAWQSGGV